MARRSAPSSAASSFWWESRMMIRPKMPSGCTILPRLHALPEPSPSTCALPTSCAMGLQMSQNLGRAFVGRRRRQGVEHERHADGLRGPPGYVRPAHKRSFTLHNALTRTRALSSCEQSASSLFMATSRVTVPPFSAGFGHEVLLLVFAHALRVMCVHAGNKPDFHKAMGSDRSKAFYEAFVEMVKSKYQADKIQGFPCAPPCFGFMSAHTPYVSFTTCAMRRWSVWGDDGGGARQRRPRHAADRFSRQVVEEEAHTTGLATMRSGGWRTYTKKHHNKAKGGSLYLRVCFTCVCVVCVGRTNAVPLRIVVGRRRNRSLRALAEAESFGLANGVHESLAQSLVVVVLGQIQLVETGATRHR